MTFNPTVILQCCKTLTFYSLQGLLLQALSQCLYCTPSQCWSYLKKGQVITEELIPSLTKQASELARVSTMHNRLKIFLQDADEVKYSD